MPIPYKYIYMKESLTKYKKTKKGMSAHIYGQQRSSSRERGHEEPTFTLEEFREWLYAQPNFETLFDGWIASGYDTDFRPSPDRLNDKLGYSFSNLQLLTWKGNKERSMFKNGRGSVFFLNTVQAWCATIWYNGKSVHIKRSKDKQVVIDALEQWKKDNL